MTKTYIFKQNDFSAFSKRNGSKRSQMYISDNYMKILKK